MIQFIKNLWIKWKYRKYFRSLKTQSEYYDQLARSLNIVYLEREDKNITELKGKVEVPNLLHQPVKVKELYIERNK